MKSIKQIRRAAGRWSYSKSYQKSSTGDRIEVDSYGYLHHYRNNRSIFNKKYSSGAVADRAAKMLMKKLSSNRRK